MPMNLNEGNHYVVNHGEGMTAVDFSGHVSLVEKESADMTGMAVGWRSDPAIVSIAVEEASSCKDVETEVDGHDAVGVPVATLVATGVRMVRLLHDGDLLTTALIEEATAGRGHWRRGHGRRCRCWVRRRKLTTTITTTVWVAALLRGAREQERRSGANDWKGGRVALGRGEHG
ncbi:hypothetical protein GW17_00044812 [Ensete ventricosum]|nr:hypothetical protein GW17_00044812 [Ensete ventricosum]